MPNLKIQVGRIVVQMAHLVIITFVALAYTMQQRIGEYVKPEAETDSARNMRLLYKW